MASLPRSENNSLRYHYLDNGVNNESRNMPMASADFGAESGAYFLKSTPLTAYPEYKTEPDPRKNAAGVASMEELLVDDTPSEVKKVKRRRRRLHQKITGAQVDVTVETTPSCDTLRWETLPRCLVKTVIDVTGELSEKIQGGAPPSSRADDDLVTILTRDNRLIYLSVLFLLLYFVYRILRRC